MTETREPGVRQTTYKQPGGYVPTEATEAFSVAVERVEGQIVILRQSEADQVTGDRVSMEQSSALTIEAKSAQVDRSAVRTLEAERAVAQRSRIGRLVSGELWLVKSQVLALSAERAQLEHARVVLFAGRAEGEVRPLLTLSGASALGAGLGLALGLMLALVRALGDRR